jgi:energy-coupling factor transport system ATP-binding protein
MKKIVIENLCVKYPSTYTSPESSSDSLRSSSKLNLNNYVLKDINLTISPGEFVVISGFSGVGKTTLLSCINGIAKNFYRAKIEGNIIVNNKNIKSLRIGDISQFVGTVLQDTEAQIFNLQVEDEVAFGCENLGIDPDVIRERVKKYCNILEIDTEAQINKLSIGQRQRVIMASVLAMEQGILLLDEPLVNLDFKTADRILRFLKELSIDYKKTIIIVEHRLDLVLPFLTRLIWLENGVILDDFNQEEAFKKYLHLFNSEPKELVHEFNEPIFEINHCNLGYKKKIILRDLNLKICDGERIIILGENGSGKTTFLRFLAGLIKQKSGEIWRNPDLRRNTFKKVGYVYQNPNYQLFMDSVYKEIEFQSKDEETVNEYIKLFRISHLRDRHPFTSSEGEKRLITIAAIASMKPRILLLDEPTVGQDYNGLTNLIKILDTIQQKDGTCIIVVTHDIRCASALGNRVLWFEDEKIYKEGDHSLVEAYFKRNY